MRTGKIMTVTRFKSGQSGNPGGRPKVDPALRLMLSNAAPKAAECLVRIAQDDTHKDQFKAIERILDYTLGRVGSPIDYEAQESHDTSGLERFTGLLETLIKSAA
jgi:hypothetical protein